MDTHTWMGWQGRWTKSESETSREFWETNCRRLLSILVILTL